MKEEKRNLGTGLCNFRARASYQRFADRVDLPYL